MKCEDINLIEFIEGAAPGEIKTHINKCTKCREDSERLSEFFNNVLPIYKAGKEINEKIERELKAMDVADMVPLPRELAQKVAYLRNRRLTERLKKVIGKGRESAQELMESILAPSSQAQPMPASPKDMTVKKKKGGKKKGKPDNA
jgi:hypothetical protein